MSKKITFEGVQRQQLTIYWRLTLDFMRNSAQRKSLIYVFQEFSASVNKTFIFAGTLSTRLSFYEV